MLRDTKSNVAMLIGHAPASRSGASLVGSSIVNMGQYLSGSFMLNVGAKATTAATLAAKLQYSSSSTFGSDVNDDDGTKGNTAPMTGLAASTAYRFHIQKPYDDTKPYYRLAVTDGVAAVTYSSVFVGIPKVTPVSYS